jgi:hypothetical protein
MIYMALYVMFLKHADPLRGQVGGGWVLEIETLLVAISGPKKVDLHASKTLRTGPNESKVHAHYTAT